MRLLDLFCGAGGCSVGYRRAGFTEIVGVDNKPQPHYPFEFVETDALEYLSQYGKAFDAIHASPPCQRYSRTRLIHNSGLCHADLVGPCRELLENTGRPYLIENVPEARLRNPAVLCGLMFGLRFLRHRQFEANFLILEPPHPKHSRHLTTGTSKRFRNRYSTGASGLVCVAGNGFNRAAGAAAMGINWPMTQRELAQAIPPAYTEYLGRQLIRHILAKTTESA